MHIFRTRPLVRKLGERAVGPEEQAQYLLVSFLLFNVAYYSGLVLTTAAAWTLMSVLEAVLIMFINVVGILKTFDASGGKANPDFLVEFTCLYVPVSITTLLGVWGAYWAITLGFREALIALSHSHFQFAMNLSRLGTDLFGFLTLAANVGLLGITYIRLSKLLARVRRAKAGA